MGEEPLFQYSQKRKKRNYEFHCIGEINPYKIPHNKRNIIQRWKLITVCQIDSTIIFIYLQVIKWDFKHTN